MAVKIVKPREAVLQRGLKAIIYGQSGVGKTVMSTTAGEPTLIISAEGGLLSIQDAPDYVDTVEINSINEIKEIYEMLYNGTDYKWVVIDSLSEVGEVVLSTEKAKSKDPRQAYGALIDEMGILIRAFRDLPGYHVVMTAKQERVEIDGSTVIVPSMPGSKLAQQLPYWFDEVLALRIHKDPETGEEIRFVQTCLDYSHVAKDRSGKLDQSEPPSLQHIAAKILGNNINTKAA